MQLTQVSSNTSGKLVSTTDIKRAGLLKKIVTISSLIGNKPGHFEQIDASHLLIIAGHEIYELQV
jgi:hypothetical protein